MMNKKEIGEEGEKAACTFLVENGYQIIEKNYRFKRWEIDIIARKKDLLVFVEVKTRASFDFGFPEETLNNKQKRNIINTAKHYIFQVNWQQDIRFDIFAVSILEGNTEIVHFEDAFY